MLIFLSFYFFFFSFLANTFQHGCLGKPSLCDSDATVVCEMNGTAPLLCECVYVSGLLNLPTCEDQVQQQPPSNGKTNDYFNTSNQIPDFGGIFAHLVVCQTHCIMHIVHII